MATTLRDAFSVTRFSFWAGALLSSLVGSLLYIVTAHSIEGDAETRFVNHAKHGHHDAPPVPRIRAGAGVAAQLSGGRKHEFRGLRHRGRPRRLHGRPARGNATPSRQGHSVGDLAAGHPPLLSGDRLFRTRP